MTRHTFYAITFNSTNKTIITVFEINLDYWYLQFLYFISKLSIFFKLKTTMVQLKFANRVLKSMDLQYLFFKYIVHILTPIFLNTFFNDQYFCKKCD